MLSNRYEISVSPDVYLLSSLSTQKPDALTPEVMVFFGLMAFLAVFGAKGGGA